MGKSKQQLLRQPKDLLLSILTTTREWATGRQAETRGRSRELENISACVSKCKGSNEQRSGKALKGLSRRTLSHILVVLLSGGGHKKNPY